MRTATGIIPSYILGKSYTQEDGRVAGPKAIVLHKLQCDTMIIHTQHLRLGWESSVGIATRYGLDGPGIESS